MCSEDDLKSIGLPLGPRKKILKFIADREQKEKAKEPVAAAPAPVVAALPPAVDRLTIAQPSRQVSW